jgi:hypothetical protein
MRLGERLRAGERQRPYQKRATGDAVQWCSGHDSPARRAKFGAGRVGPNSGAFAERPQRIVRGPILFDSAAHWARELELDPGANAKEKCEVPDGHLTSGRRED